MKCSDRDMDRGPIGQGCFACHNIWERALADLELKVKGQIISELPRVHSAVAAQIFTFVADWC